MSVTVARDAALVTIELSGSIDARDSIDFERQVLDQLAEDARLFAVDFEHVTLMTGAGIRVLMMLTQRLRAVEGVVVLCAMSDQVRSVFDKTGLSRQFSMTSSRGEALAQLSAVPSVGRADTHHTTKLSRLVNRLLEDAAAEPDTRRTDKTASEAACSALTDNICTLLRAEEVPPA